jgi:signal transduction histidine kinase
VANLLTNAAKYTPAGGDIALRAEREADGMLVVRVKDNGTGLPPDMLPKVFELFYQGPRDLERAQGGLGIGLALVRSLVLLHGGNVEAHSEGAGRGSEFIVRLPSAGGNAS